jgi:hypothetical protein
MALKPPRIPGAEDQTADSFGRAQPIRPVWQGALIWFVSLALFLAIVAIAVRSFLVPALSGGSSTPSAAEAHLSALQTQEALAPQPTAAPAPASTTAATVAAAVVAPTAQLQMATPAATQAPTAPAVTLTVEATPGPTISPELTAEVSQAYLRYFQVSADALLNLDPIPLDAVAAGDALAGLQTQIEEDRAAGRAIRTEVAHNFTVVSANNNHAQVADDYRDSSVFVDPATRQPLPGEVVPASPQDAPEVKVLYQLRRVSGSWKVVGGQKYE